jgi:hypothetical protein
MEAEMWFGEPTTDSGTAEILTVWCDMCGDKLHTEKATHDLLMCQCGFTSIDNGIVRLDVR